MNEFVKNRMIMSMVIFAVVFLAVASVLPFVGEAETPGDNTFTVHVYVHDVAGNGINNVTVHLKEAGGASGGDTLQTQTTAAYTPIVQNESLGLGDGAEDTFYVEGAGNIMDWAVEDDTVDVSDVLLYIAGTLKTPTTHYTLDTDTGAVTIVTAPTSGQEVTATYKYNKGPGHVQFASVNAGDAVLVCEKDDHITEYQTVTVAADSVYIIEMYEWGEFDDAVAGGSPVAVLTLIAGVGIGLLAVGRYAL